MTEFDAGGPPAIAVRARALDALEGREVELRLASDDVVRGTAAGIDDDGRLLVRDGDLVGAYASGEVVRLT